MKIEFGYSIFPCTNLDVDWNVGHSLSAGGPPSAHLRLWGHPWTRFSRRSLAPSVPNTFVITLDRTLCIQTEMPWYERAFFLFVRNR